MSYQAVAANFTRIGSVRTFGALQSPATNHFWVIGKCLAYGRGAWARMQPASIEPSIHSTAVTSGIKHQMLRNIPCRFDVGHTSQ